MRNLFFFCIDCRSAGPRISRGQAWPDRRRSLGLTSDLYMTMLMQLNRVLNQVYILVLNVLCRIACRGRSLPVGTFCRTCLPDFCIFSGSPVLSVVFGQQKVRTNLGAAPCAIPSPFSDIPLSYFFSEGRESKEGDKCPDRMGSSMKSRISKRICRF